MALNDNQNETKQTIKTAFADKMEELFPLPDDMSGENKADIRDNWEKLGEAVAEILPALCSHIVDNAAIGTVISDVDGDLATQNNPGKDLIR